MSNSEPIREFDPNGNLIYFRNSNGYEIWYEYDTDGRCIYARYSNEFKTWYKYDENGNYVYYEDSEGVKVWYDSKGNVIDSVGATEVQYHHEQQHTHS
jgi:YD repeat-containing protein